MRARLGRLNSRKWKQNDKSGSAASPGSKVRRSAADAIDALQKELADILRRHVAKEIGPIAKPRDLILVPDLPKTRSGKIMRRLLGDIVDRRPLGDTTSLQDENVPHQIEQIVHLKP